MEIPDWDDYEALKKRQTKLEQTLYRVAELTGIAKYSFRGEVFDTREEANNAETKHYDAEKQNIQENIKKGKSPLPTATGCFYQPTVVVELPEL